MSKKIFFNTITWIFILAVLAAVFLLFHHGGEEKRDQEAIDVLVYDAVILFMHGDVQVKPSNVDKWTDAAIGMTLSGDDSIRTGVDSWMEIGFGKEFKNAVKVKEDTLVKLVDLYPVRIGLLNGEIRSLVEQLEEGSTFEVETPTAVCGARGTGWDISTDGRRVIVDTFENEVYFHKISEEGVITEFLNVKAGERGILKDQREPIAIKDIPTDRVESWDIWKSDFTERKETIVLRMQKGAKGVPKKRPKVWVEETDNGGFQLMVTPEEGE